MTAKDIFTVLLALVPAFVLSRIVSFCVRKMKVDVENQWEYEEEAQGNEDEAQ